MYLTQNKPVVALASGLSVAYSPSVLCHVVVGSDLHYFDTKLLLLYLYHNACP